MLSRLGFRWLLSTIFGICRSADHRRNGRKVQQASVGRDDNCADDRSCRARTPSNPVSRLERLPCVEEKMVIAGPPLPPYPEDWPDQRR